MNAVCRAVKRDGAPCTLPATDANGYCWAHSPDNAEKRRRIASKGGKGKPGRELRDIKTRLSDLADGVLDGSTDRATGAVASQILNVYLRAVTVEMKIREQEEVLERLEALEQRTQGDQRQWR